MTDRAGDAGDSAFRFTGTWREYAPIAFANLLLTIVTLGVYSFWAKTRTRRYLWSRTRFIEDRLEWTGTGLELFVGYVLAMVLFLVPLALLQFGIQALAIRGHNGLAVLMVVLLYPVILYLFGVAIFRALRYRLSRTYWRGIRGGSDEQGFAYGWQSLWRTVLGAAAFGVMVPWSMTSLWNRRFNAMSFGPLRFDAHADWNRIIARYLLFYLAPILLFVGLLAAGGAGVALGALGSDSSSPDAVLGGLALVTGLFVLIFYGLMGLIALYFYSAYYREVVGNTTLGPLSFSFEARTREWVKLMLGNIGLVIVTLGIGFIFIGYRNWSFAIRHLRGYGEIELDTLTQSTTRTPGQGEGLLDAFDIGAI